MRQGSDSCDLGSNPSRTSFFLARFFFLSPRPSSTFDRDPGDPRQRPSHKAARRPRDGPNWFRAASSFALRVASLSGGSERACSAGSTWLMATLNELESMRKSCVIERLAPRDAALHRRRLVHAERTCRGGKGDCTDRCNGGAVQGRTGSAESMDGNGRWGRSWGGDEGDWVRL